MLLGAGPPTLRAAPHRASSAGRRRICLLTLALAASLAVGASAGAAASQTAYVTNGGTNSVTPVDLASNTPAPVIGVGGAPFSVAITPDGVTAYVTNARSDDVTPIEIASNTAGSPIAVGEGPIAIAITPDGATAYVANSDAKSVTPIDIANNAAGKEIPVGSGPVGVAITPDGATAYVTNFYSSSVTPIDTATNTPGTPIAAVSSPVGIAITPDGRTAYVTNPWAGFGPLTNYVTPIDIATNAAGTPIPARGNAPASIAIAPDGATAYVGNGVFSNSLTPIDIATNTSDRTPIALPGSPASIAVAPDGATAYVATFSPDVVTPIDTATNTLGMTIPIGGGPQGIAITPNQAPAAAFSAAPGADPSQAVFDGTGSTDPDGQIARYDWDFGDGATLADGGPTPSHTYAGPGSYDVTLTVTDDEGCSTELVFTGQTAHCNGKPSAETAEAVVISGDAVDGSARAESPQAQKRNKIVVKVKVVAGEVLTAEVSGEVSWRGRSYQLKPKTKQVAPGRSKKLKLKLKGKEGKQIARALQLGETATADLVVVLTDEAGNSKSEQLSVILER